MILRALGFLLFAVFLSLSASVSAQSDADKTTARALYFEGKDAFDAKDFGTAVDRFHRSNALYPAPTAAIALARSLRESGKLVQAFETYQSIVKSGHAGVSQAFDNALKAAAVEQAEIEPRLAVLVIDVDCPTGAVEGGCQPTVMLDGAKVPPASIGVKRFVDPGTRQIVVRAVGWLEVSREVVVGEGQTERIHVTLEPARSPQPMPRAGTSEEPLRLPQPEPPVAQDRGEGGSGLRVAGLVLGGFGLVSLVVAGVTGALYLTTKADVEAKCPDRLCETQQDVKDASVGHTMGLVNTITLPVGAAALGTGVLLFLLAPSSEGVAAAPWVGPSLGGVSVRGLF